ncbi:MAG TPA: hypothetical protein ENI23_17290 [bacterium]|nr:hypothetical protein [bacterium]
MKKLNIARDDSQFYRQWLNKHDKAPVEGSKLKIGDKVTYQGEQYRVMGKGSAGDINLVTMNFKDNIDAPESELGK